MLSIIVPGIEVFDEESQKFGTQGDVTLTLEHSLVSLSKWESEFEKPFLGVGEKTTDEVIAYVKAMILTPDFSPEVFERITDSNIEDINNYINAKKSATWFNDTANVTRSTEVITSELIYYWMTAFNIPWEAQHWHLNRLFTLIRVCSVKNSSKQPKKRSRAEMVAERQRLNAERRAQLNSQG